jgi:hypothetical protein
MIIDFDTAQIQPRRRCVAVSKQVSEFAKPISSVATAPCDTFGIRKPLMLNNECNFTDRFQNSGKDVNHGMGT